MINRAAADGGAIWNTIAALTGARLRHLPMLPERVKQALREVAKA